MSTSRYLGPGVLHLRNSVCLIFVTWMSTQFIILQQKAVTRLRFKLGAPRCYYATAPAQPQPGAENTGLGMWAVVMTRFTRLNACAQ